MKGRFITIEGTEGVGKTTCLAAIETILVQRGISVRVTREPGGTELGEDIRKLLLKNRVQKMSTETELLLLFAARAQHIEEVILPALNAGQWVLCDRFTDASYAYQGAGRGVEVAHIAYLEKHLPARLTPDLTFVLDAPVEVGLARTHRRGQLDRIEQEALFFFEKVRAAYLSRAHANPKRFAIIDAEGTPPEVNQQLEQHLANWLAKVESVS